MKIIFDSNIDSSMAGQKAYAVLHKDNKSLPIERHCIVDDLNNALYVIAKVDGAKIELIPVDRDVAVRIKAEHHYVAAKMINQIASLDISVNHLIN